MIGYVLNMTEKALKSAETIDDINGALNFAFESFDSWDVPIETQWRYIGIMFDKLRKGEL